ncbi:MAG TPA: ergothioneine biosynthesis protein EgtB [Acidimicrobiales bacterium]|nr:ergothioneine biosynthesis protein EgtB [Acidimicrobiales bacterium]
MTPGASTTAGKGTETLRERYRLVRELTEALAAPLSPEDQTVQSMPDVSPTKWHRAHVSWFFETFLLRKDLPGYRAFHPVYEYLFNSYYEGVGDRYPRPRRGVVSRPGVGEVTAYRSHVDDAMDRLLDRALRPETEDLVELGINHEQQHQELVLMDIKHVLSCNPIQPAYTKLEAVEPKASPPAELIESDGGMVEVGHDDGGFAFDNESPRHGVLLAPFALDARPVTCGDWMAFIDDAGYRRPELWLSDGWATVCAEGWEAPEYWSWIDDRWWSFTLGGPKHVDPAEPVCHVSYYEADAFARWARARLPTEAEWEAAAATTTDADAQSGFNFLDLSVLHPRPVKARSPLFGEVWQWTSSSYGPYPGFRPAAGAVGEYNGKFMVNQYVLRGGCCVTPPGHVRATYRNFFPPGARWAFSGLRLAHDA